MHPSENVDSKDQDKCDYLLDCEITSEEIFNVIKKAKNGKAPGLDELPVEVLKNQTALSFLVRLFNVYYNTGKVPVLWAKGVIVPVPKCSSSDPRDPLSYRGITLAPATYKLYKVFLTVGCGKKFDASDIIHDEQNGFRKDRNTIDHLLSITSIIESRKLRLSVDALNQIPSDAELLRFSSQCDPENMHELATHLGMHRKWKVIRCNYPQDIEIAIFLFLIEWKRKNSKGKFKVLADVLEKMNLTAHMLCYVSEIRIRTLNTGNTDYQTNPNVFEDYTSLADYHIFPSEKQFVRFTIEACHDAFILLSAALDLESHDFYEICLGGSDNQDTYLRRRYNDASSFEISTPDILGCTEKRTFEIRWTIEGTIHIVKESAVGIKK
ncbi:unnamed protein product [Mytilus edulis]|uniref:Farnesoic acid O-methyl transferase domain-containing protein n=1 Tax=Mytilus edulis TaxID=6550 RepID=A0A8S3Q1Z7_MYTED|nr:unnamed protein product [Mytilus edulis]